MRSVWRSFSAPTRILIVAFITLVVGVGSALAWLIEGPTQPGPPTPLDAPTQQLASRLEAHVTHLAKTIGERHIGRPGSLERSRAYIRQHLEAAGLEVRVETFRSYGVEVANLYAELRGTKTPQRVFVVGAHYDTVPDTPGADDNASGVAAMLEMARALSEAPLPITVRFVAFVNEEPPFFHDETMGSLVHARNSQTRGDELIGMWSLEMLGYYNDAEGSQGYPAGLGLMLPDRGDFIGFVSNLRSRSLLQQSIKAFERAGRIPAIGLSAPTWITGVDFSDHWSFWQIGVPALMVTDTAFMRNPHYHEPTDAPATLDYDRFARVVKGLIAALPRAAGG